MGMREELQKEEKTEILSEWNAWGAQQDAAGGRGCDGRVISHAADFQCLCISPVSASDKDVFWEGLAS